MFRPCATVLAVWLLFALQVSAQDGSTAGAPSQAGSSASAQPSVSGTVAYRERVALPPDAAIDIKLQDVSQQDTSAKTVAESLFAPGGKQVPIPFQLSYNTSDINPTHAYQVRATISVNGKLMFSSTTAYPVITQGAPSQVDIMLQQVQAAPTTGGADKLSGTDWTLAELGGKPAVPGEGKPAHLVLHKKGKLSGSTGCNELMGTYIAQQGALQFTPAGTTMKMCSPAVVQQEQAFLAALKATTKYKIEGDTLELMNNEQVLAKFQAASKQ